MSHFSCPYIPRIDISPILKEGLESQSAEPVLDQIRSACSEIGFMVVSGHGVEHDLVEAMGKAARSFFALDPKVKLQGAPRSWNKESSNAYRGYFPSSANGKEGLDIGDPRLSVNDRLLLSRRYYELNRFPAELDENWRSVISLYFDALSKLGRCLMEAMVSSLGGDPTRVAEAFPRPGGLSTLRFNFYPENVDPVEISDQDGAWLGCETHVDSGIMTILHQDSVGGLQVRDRERRWVDVPYEQGTFVVNTGLAMHRMTNRVFPAPPHRVLFSRTSRLSIPFFMEPVHDFVVASESLGLNKLSDLEAPTYEAFLHESLKKFAEYDR